MRRRKKLRIALIVILLIPALLLGSFAAWLFVPRMIKPRVTLHETDWNTNYSFVFVHGLSGWGSYDEQYKQMPYWGMLNGDLMAYLNGLGYRCCAASVAPQRSAWDRACELYAQLTGTVVDYGAAHSAEMGHDRYGADFTGRALIEKWSAEDKITLLGHSFGGATVRLLVSLMAQGDKAERAATDPAELSPLFTGGKADWVHSVVTLAAPSNGTTAYHAPAEPENDTWLETKLGGLMSAGTSAKPDGRDTRDYAAYDMHIDRALALNEALALPENVWYFAVPCSATRRNGDGTYNPVNGRMEILFRSDSRRMGHYTGVTEGGFVIDGSWQENDGLVNTVSAMAPTGQPARDYDGAAAGPGVWNVMPVYDGDHMSLQGGLTKRNDVRRFYAELLDMINCL